MKKKNLLFSHYCRISGGKKDFFSALVASSEGSRDLIPPDPARKANVEVYIY